MSAAITILVVLVGGLCVGLARVLRDRERQEARTREWIQFLNDDLSRL